MKKILLTLLTLLSTIILVGCKIPPIVDVPTQPTDKPTPPVVDIPTQPDDKPTPPVVDIPTQPDDKPNPPTEEVKPSIPKKSFMEMLDISAITSINMLNSSIRVNTMRRTALTDEQKIKVIENFDLVDELLKGDLIKSEELSIPVDSVYYGEYDKFYTLTINEMTGAKTEYTFYYREILVESLDNPQTLEVSSILNGIVILDGQEFSLYGNKNVINVEKDVEVEFSYIITDEKTNEKVLVRPETDTGNGKKENQYSYTRHDASGKLVEKVKIDFEQEGDKIAYSIKSMTDSVMNEYIFKYEEQAEQKLVRVKIIINQGMIQLSLLVRNQGGYEFIE